MNQSINRAVEPAITIIIKLKDQNILAKYTLIETLELILTYRRQNLS